MARSRAGGANEWERQAERDAARQRLRRAVDQKDLPGIRKAIGQGAEIDFVELDGNSALMSASARGSGAPVVRELIRLGANPNQTREADGRTPLIASLLGSTLQVTMALIELGADPNQTDAEGASPLALASITRQAEAFAALLAAGASVSASDEARPKDEESLMEGLLKRAMMSSAALAEAAGGSLRGWANGSALHCCLRRQSGERALEMARWVLEKTGPEELFRRNSEGQTPWELAAAEFGPESAICSELRSAMERVELEGLLPSEGADRAAGGGPRL